MTSRSSSHIGQRIKELRKVAKLTQQELADGIVTRSYISQIEKGSIQPSYDTLAQLAMKLNVTLEELYKEPENLGLRLAEIKKTIKFAEAAATNGEFEKAKRYLADHASFQTVLNDYDLGVMHWTLGAIATSEQNYENALACYQQSLSHLQRLDWSKEMLRVYVSIAKTYEGSHNDQAVDWILSAYEMAVENLVSGQIKATLLFTIARILFGIGDFNSALFYARKAADLYQKCKMDVPSYLVEMIGDLKLATAEVNRLFERMKDNDELEPSSATGSH
ncbi:helix-turn-helix domain-containing protein [Tumebacillus algifaecis]|nr:helix-turn-helix transcriptional regulator [Tumebacillus algifaecis]